MGSVLLGQTANVPIPVTDGGSPPVAVDPSTITAKIIDNLTGIQVGATDSLAGGQITKLAVGSYQYLPSTGVGGKIASAGSYAIDVQTTNPTGRSLTWLDVVAAVPPLIDLAGGKKQLGKTSGADDAELRFFIDAVNWRMEEECGAIIPRQVAETVAADRRGRLFPSTTPILSLVSVTQNGVTIPTLGFRVGETEISLPTAQRYPVLYGSSLLVGLYDLVIVAGRSPVPPTLPLAARMLLQHWWKTQRSSTALQPIGADDPAGAYLAAVAAGRRYDIPPDVAGMIAPHVQGLTFA